MVSKLLNRGEVKERPILSAQHFLRTLVPYVEALLYMYPVAGAAMHSSRIKSVSDHATGHLIVKSSEHSETIHFPESELVQVLLRPAVNEPPSPPRYGVAFLLVDIALKVKCVRACKRLLRWRMNERVH